MVAYHADSVGPVAGPAATVFWQLPTVLLACLPPAVVADRCGSATCDAERLDAGGTEGWRGSVAGLVEAHRISGRLSDSRSRFPACLGDRGTSATPRAPARAQLRPGVLSDPKAQEGFRRAWRRPGSLEWQMGFGMSKAWFGVRLPTDVRGICLCCLIRTNCPNVRRSGSPPLCAKWPVGR